MKDIKAKLYCVFSGPAAQHVVAKSISKAIDCANKLNMPNGTTGLSKAILLGKVWVIRDKNGYSWFTPRHWQSEAFGGNFLYNLSVNESLKTEYHECDASVLFDTLEME